MAKKLQQFWIRKISSDRLRDSNYKMEMSLDNARKNQELISVSDSQLIRTLHEITEKKFSQTKVDELLAEKKKISSFSNSSKNRIASQKINKELDDLLFIQELVSISFSDKRHSQKLLKLGKFILNGEVYRPFMASSGMIRRNTMLFCQEKYKDELLRILNNNRNTNEKIVPAKYGVYLSLYSSSSIDVTFPRIAVIPDLIINTVREVEFSRYIDDNTDPETKLETKTLELNAFDGQGLVSPKMATYWSKDLQLDYVPASFLVRSSFLKGLCVTFDFHALAEKNGISQIKDVYGNIVPLDKVDVLISESQFKLWGCYESTDAYIKNCENNHLGWGISRWSPKEDKNYAFSSYQFIQSLNKYSIENELCEPTVKWLNDSSGGDVSQTLLYLLGDMEFEDGWFSRIDPTMQAFLLENELINDFYFSKKFDKIIGKKKKEACMGRLVFPANYSFMISDPYAQCIHALGLPLRWLVDEGECYSNYWKKKNSDKIAVVRSPIVHYSEVDVLDVVQDENMNEWYKHINSGIIFPPYGVSLDMAILGGAD